MKLAHSGDDRLPGFVVGVDAETRIFLSKTIEGDAHFVLVLTGFRLDRDTHDRFREIHRLKNDRLVFVRNGVAGRGIFHTANGNDLACRCRFDVFTLISVHEHQTPDAFFRIFDRVRHIRTRTYCSRINTHKCQLP